MGCGHKKTRPDGRDLLWIYLSLTLRHKWWPILDYVMALALANHRRWEMRIVEECSVWAVQVHVDQSGFIVEKERLRVSRQIGWLFMVAVVVCLHNTS